MNTSLDTLNIDTPENVTFSYEIAGIGSRFLAAIIDSLLIGLLQVILFGTGLLILIRMGVFASSDSSGGQAAMWILAILSLIGFVFFWGYYIFFEIFWNGQTPGKRWIGLRVIRMDGTPVSFSEVLIRNLVRTLDFLPFAYGVGVITMFASRNSCRLGDLAARTVVVHDREAALEKGGSMRLRDELSLLYGQGQLPDNFPLEKVTDQDMSVLETFFARRAALANRHQLADYLLRSLYARLELPSTDPALDNDPERALAVIYQAKLNRHNPSTGAGV